MAIDPVCGMKVDEQQALDSTHFEQRAYYFCSAACKADFERDPRKYVNPDGSLVNQPSEQGGFIRDGDAVHTSGFSHEGEMRDKASGPQPVPPRPQQANAPGQHVSGRRQGRGGKQKKFGT